MRKLFMAALLALPMFVIASQNSTVLPTTGTVSGLQMTQNINNAMDTIASMQSGSSNPGATGAYRFWADTGNNLLRQRNAANTDWVTISPLLTGLAPLASPALTGTPTAPTASTGTNNTQIATTNYVVNRVANDAPTKTGSGASGTWAINVTGSAGSATSATNATNATYATYVGGYAASQLWRTDQGSFTGGNPWQVTFPNGFMIKGGTVTSTLDSDETFNFAAAFPNGCLNIQLTVTTANSGFPIGSHSCTASGFVVDRPNSMDGNYTFSYTVFGY